MTAPPTPPGATSPSEPTATGSPVSAHRHRRGGPPLIAPALAWAGLTVVGAVLYPGLRPDTDPPTTLRLLQGSPTASWSALLLIAAAIPLLVLAAAVHQRFHALGVRVAGPTIGLVGGLLAAVALVVSGLAGWTASVIAPVAGPDLVAALTRLGYAAGGPVFAAGLALAIAGAAVPALILRFVPRWFAVVGLVVSGFGVLALLALVVPVLAPALPVVRFGGLVWWVVVALLMPMTRRSVAR